MFPGRTVVRRQLLFDTFGPRICIDNLFLDWRTEMKIVSQLTSSVSKTFQDKLTKALNKDITCQTHEPHKNKRWLCNMEALEANQLKSFHQVFVQFVETSRTSWLVGHRQSNELFVFKWIWTNLPRYILRTYWTRLIALRYGYQRTCNYSRFPLWLNVSDSYYILLTQRQTHAI